MSMIYEELIAVWLKREFSGANERYTPLLSTYLPDTTIEDLEFLVDSPNLNNQKENYLRHFLLWSYRYPLLLPCWNANWSKRLISIDEFKELYVLKASGWQQISINETMRMEGRLLDVANNVYQRRANPIPDSSDHHVPYENMISTLPGWERSHSLEDLNTQLVLLETDENKTILEGNKTATSLFIKWFINSETRYSPIEVFIGNLENKCMWQW